MVSGKIQFKKHQVSHIKVYVEFLLLIPLNYATKQSHSV